MNKTPKRLKLNQEPIKVPKKTSPTTLGVFNTSDSTDNLSVNGSPNENNLCPRESRRGRPRAEILNTLMLEGSSSLSPIKCTYCGRVFPREKSLQAHLRTHTGERPYACDYPRCTRRFTQSGQLKTHQRLHTGEKPFICTVQTCGRRFTHANRHCPEHPEHHLKRFLSSSSSTSDDEQAKAIEKWLKNNTGRITNGISDTSDVSSSRKSVESIERSGNEENENINNYVKGFSRKLSVIDSESSYGSQKSSYESNFTDENSDLEGSIASLSSSLPSASFLNTVDSKTGQKNGFTDVQKTMNLKGTEAIELPKKRWLREATQDQQRWDSFKELAHPINWDDFNLVEYENQRRPTVLMKVQDYGQTKKVSRADIQTAIALVELKNGRPFTPCQK